MQLESALRSSSLGISSHGKAIAVVGDNISNVNTYGFKKSRAEFVDILAEGRDGRSSVAGPTVGDGATVEQVRQIFTTGIIEDTGRNLDVAIDGDGFFVVGSAEDPSFTRSGIFSLDETGTLIDSQGNIVLGFGPGVANGAIADLGPLSTAAVETIPAATTTIDMGAVLDSSSPIVAGLPADGASNLEVGQSASFTYSTSVIDSLGESHEVTMAFFKTGLNTWTVRGYSDGSEVGQEAGVAVQVAPDLNLTFSETGELTVDPAILNFDLPYSNGAAAGAVAVDLGRITQVAATSGVSTVIADGYAAAPVDGVDGIEFDKGGNVLVVFADGRSQALGVLALADFPSVDGLAREGDLTFTSSAAAGDLTVGLATTAGFGTIRPGALERSTVDIAEEFVNMVVYQRGYEANSQAFSASSGLLQQTIQLIR
jgi:flagellar hook protein FlgE